MSSNSNTTSEFENKLFNSNSFKSNEIEKKVVTALEKRNWHVLRSPYYRDPKSLKFRELDIKANYKYTTKNFEKKYYVVDYTLILECKTLNGYHILFDGTPSQVANRPNVYRVWSGNDNYNGYEIFRQILSKNHINVKSEKKIIEGLSNMHFPKGESSIGDYQIEPCPIQAFSSFRETNIGTEKDFDNSVIWKASQELQSVIASEEIEYYDTIESNVSGELELHTEEILKSNKKSVTLCKKVIKDWGRIRDFQIIYPILVVDCNLWDITESEKIKPLQFCRLLFTEMNGFNKHWIDIVTLKHIDNYLEIISSHYLANVDEKTRLKI